MTDYIKLQNRIAETRKARNLSPAKLGEMVGISKEAINSIENGKLTPSAKLAYVLCIALDTTFEELYYLE